MTRIMIMGGQPITALGLRALIDNGLPGCKATELDIAAMPDILTGHVTCDLLVYINGGPGGKAEITLGKSGMPVLYITNNLGFIQVQDLYKNGARGVVDMSNTAAVVLGAIGEVLSGHTFMEQAFKEQLLKGFDTAANTGPVGPVLTKRERQIAELMLDGKKMCEIGRSLGLKASTVTTFKTRIFEKFGVDSVLGLNEAFGPRGGSFV